MLQRYEIKFEYAPKNSMNEGEPRKLLIIVKHTPPKTCINICVKLPYHGRTIPLEIPYQMPLELDRRPISRN